MNHSEYNALINDTLAYIKKRLPSKAQTPKIKLPSPPKPQRQRQLKKETLVSSSPPAPQPPKLKTETPKTFLTLAPPKNPMTETSSEIRNILREIDPDLYIHETVPSDYKAKRIKEAWREKRLTPSIPILFQGTEYQRFVTQIAKAIDTVYGSCRLVEITPNKKWDLFLESENLRLVIIPDTLLFGNKELLPFYQETPQQKVRKLGTIPLLLLPDLSLYYKDPYLKRSLWNVICNTIDSLPSS